MILTRQIFCVILCVATLSTSAQLHSNVAPDLLLEMRDSVRKGHYSKIHGMLIAKGGSLVSEDYFDGFSRDSLHDSRSSFKSITSLLVGIAIDKGFIKSVYQKVYEFFPQFPWFGLDPLKRQLTIRNLLEMKSGLDCEEFNDTKDCEDQMSESEDWVKYALGIRMLHAPGRVWAYTSADPVILSGVLRAATGMGVREFAQLYLFGPMGIDRYQWTMDPSGNAMTAGSFFIRPVDMVKLGQLVGGQGRWNGRQLISKKWIRRSTRGRIAIPGFSFMGSSKSSSGVPQPAYYGYFWYRERIRTDKLDQEVLFASGNGGQYIFVIRELDLTVVFTQGNFRSYRAKQAFEILARYILPYFTANGPAAKGKKQY